LLFGLIPEGREGGREGEGGREERKVPEGAKTTSSVKNIWKKKKKI
jgi:hypothetical protein